MKRKYHAVPMAVLNHHTPTNYALFQRAGVSGSGNHRPENGHSFQPSPNRANLRNRWLAHRYTDVRHTPGSFS